MQKVSGTRLQRAAWLGLTLVLLAGCSAPARKKPEFQLRNEAPLAGLPTNAPGWPAADWWHTFNDPQLNSLMARAISDAPSLQTALARYQQAMAEAGYKRADKNPELKASGNLGAGVSHYDIDTDGTDTSDTSNVLAGVGMLNFSWDLDLWGKKEAILMQAIDTAHAQKASQAAALASLQYNLASLYFNWQTEAARLNVLKNSAAVAREYLRVVKVRINAGVEEDSSLDKARAQLAQIRQQQAMLEGQQRIYHAQIAALMGVSEEELGPLTAKALPKPAGSVPQNAKLGLIARRPDIVAARWQVEAANQGINEARAYFYPDVSLSGIGALLKVFPALGSSTDVTGAVGNVGPAISLPLYNGGRLDAGLASSDAKRNTAIASYNQTVVEAAGDVAQAVLTIEQLANASKELNKQWQAADSQLIRAKARVEKGVDDPRQALSAELSLNNESDSRIQLQAQRLGAQLQLIHQLGGGYQGPAPDAYTTTKTSASEDVK
ncbi:efflux transporter outer membrane subunit [Gallaecimonas mangrovi]|uniref:efflux transporter outer membrane subunit n=1 Tax=Gallaecimonas mangrovi TaxID=2291597 RepID=UPI000E204D08|nr:efflux transporter outer membrane subunit [Gallaecimonas mangrovi]